LYLINSIYEGLQVSKRKKQPNLKNFIAPCVINVRPTASKRSLLYPKDGRRLRQLISFSSDEKTFRHCFERYQQGGLNTLLDVGVGITGVFSFWFLVLSCDTDWRANRRLIIVARYGGSGEKSLDFGVNLKYHLSRRGRAARQRRHGE